MSTTNNQGAFAFLRERSKEFALKNNFQEKEPLLFWTYALENLPEIQEILNYVPAEEHPIFYYCVIAEPFLIRKKCTERVTRDVLTIMAHNKETNKVFGLSMEEQEAFRQSVRNFAAKKGLTFKG